ncbi:restriction endonuclease subunit S [Salmonella enterica subsp. enterica]|nr:restriction endonuclease subunit S [Salmonella enterica subsp. enterica]HAK8436095.1 restriction endonuclease subunit S [Salmonella enterica]HAK8439860.1 restriction endonuclease subunit S [Salmonella enterica]
MTSEWKIAPLGEIARNVSRAFNFKNKDNVVFINTGDVLNGEFLHFNKSSVKGLPGQAKKAIANKDILYSEIRPGNKRYVFVRDCFTDDIVVSTKFMVLETKGPVIPEYLYLVLTSQECESEFKIIADSRSGTFPQITFDSVSHYPIKYPLKSIQKKIFEFDGALTSRIKINNDINQTLEQMAQALFKSWFVDFEPVKAQIAVLEAGGSQEDVTLAAMTSISGKDANALAVFEREHPEQYAELKTTAELFPSAMQESELGAIPKGWGVASISEMGKVTCGKTPSKKEPEYYGSDVPFIKIPDMHGQLFVLKTNEYLSEVGSKSQLKKLVPANSICVSCIATIGVVSITNEPSHTNQQINSVTPHKSSLLYYLYFCMLGLKDHLHILGSAGSATLNVNTSTFSGIKIAQPDAKVLELFHAKCTHLFNEIKSLSVQTESLTQLRDTLLPKLLSGKITLPEAEQIISEEA